MGGHAHGYRLQEAEFHAARRRAATSVSYGNIPASSISTRVARQDPSGHSPARPLNAPAAPQVPIPPAPIRRKAVVGHRSLDLGRRLTIAAVAWFVLTLAASIFIPGSMLWPAYIAAVVISLVVGAAVP